MSNQPKKVKLELLRATVIDGKDRFPGEVVEVSENLAAMLLNRQKAKPVEGKKSVKQNEDSKK